MPSLFDQNGGDSNLARAFFRGCVFVLLGVVALSVALALLSRIWLWLLLVAFITCALVVVARLLRWRRDRW
jgi:Flp pilus assembly protein TadB